LSSISKYKQPSHFSKAVCVISKKMPLAFFQWQVYINNNKKNFI
jgi:hypothetical protein